MQSFALQTNRVFVVMGNVKTDQMLYQTRFGKTTLFACISYKRVDPRYTVYLIEIRKRLAYITLSLFFAWVCAYTERVALLYSITFSLQKSLPQTNGQGEQIVEPFKPVDFPSSLSGINVEQMQQDGAVRLIFTDVQEAFYTLLSVSLFWCVWACLPVLVYHTLCFFQPGFYAGQSRRVCASVLKRVLWGYLVLWLVDLFLIPRLLLFFYSFQIERSSLRLHAETKVVSYVSLYVFVYGSTVALLLLTGLWSSYRRQQILGRLNMPESCKTFTRGKQLCGFESYLKNRCNPLKDRYREQRGKVWWGCLLVAALISPPDVSSQFACALLLIVWSEIGIWLAYTSSCRVSAQTTFS